MTRRHRALAVVTGSSVLLGLTAIALARPGGGDTYSGGGGHSSGGGGGGGGGDGDIGAIFELIYWTIRICIEVPYVGIPLVGGGLVWLAYSAYKQHANKDWDSGPAGTVRASIDVGQKRGSPDPLAELRRSFDPAFSRPVFEDFVFRLFSTAQRARASEESLSTVAPYVSQPARDALANRQPRGVPVEQVVVGAMRVVRVDVPRSPTDRTGQPAEVRIAVQFEANVATKGATFFSVETWVFARDASRTSKPPGATREFPCPNCGAPWQSSATGTQQCASCGKIVDNGRFDWIVEDVTVDSIDERPPTLTTEVPERGTDLPTYAQPDVDLTFEQEIQTGGDDRPTLEARLALIYTELNKAWSNGNLEPIRGFVSDGLFDYFQYWVSAYKQQGLRNQLTNMRITKTELAKVVRDTYYASVTVRIWATGKDFVVRGQTGQIVRGSKRRERPYSEYWTLIRSAARSGPAKTDKTCSNCGAPLDVTMAGACSHCGAHVTAGEFDWVLSKVEQDDSYRG